MIIKRERQECIVVRSNTGCKIARPCNYAKEYQIDIWSSIFSFFFFTRRAGQSINEHSFNYFLLKKLNLFTHAYTHMHVYISIPYQMRSAEGKEHLPSIVVDSTVSVDQEQNKICKPISFYIKQNENESVIRNAFCFLTLGNLVSNILKGG